MAAEITTEEAARFARAYVKLVEALVREGVDEMNARLDARAVAYLLVRPPKSKEAWED